MADVFISYSKADRLAVESLAALLQSKGWSVWWDRRLIAGDEFRDDIVRELDAARVVVVVWSKSSAGSEWVRAEAARARAGNKLVPVSYGGIRHEEIPLPFGEMHIEPWDRYDEIAGAVNRLLTAPAAPVSWQRLVGANLKLNFLSWFGIIGGALTVFGALRGLVTLSEWSAILVDRWHYWLYSIWSVLFDLFRVSVPRPLTALLSFILFCIALACGARQAASPDWAGEKVNVSQLALNWSIVGIIFPLIIGVAVFFGALINLDFFSSASSDNKWVTNSIAAGVAPICIMLFARVIWNRSMSSRSLLTLLLVPMCYAVVYQPSLRDGEVKMLIARHGEKLKNVMTREELREAHNEISRELALGGDAELERLAAAVELRIKDLRRECSWLALYCTEVSRPREVPLGLSASIEQKEMIKIVLEEFAASLIAFSATWFVFASFVVFAAWVAPLTLINQRLLRTLAGVCLLMTMNYISLYAPALKRWIV